MSDFVAYELATRVPQNVAMTPLKASLASVAATSGTFYTVASITGSGSILTLGAIASAFPNYVRWRITIDGNPAQVVGQASASLERLLGGMPYDNGSGAIVTGHVYLPFTPAVRFKVSALIEVAGGASSISSEVVYVLQ